MTWWYPIPKVTTTSRGYNATLPDVHLGIDFATVAPDPPLPPQPVYASSEGIVTQSGDDGSASFGDVVVITRPDGWRSLYGHLSQIDVAYGDVVAEGQQVGLSGGGLEDPHHGSSTGRHLHFQIMDGGGTNSQNTVDPAPLLTMPPAPPTPITRREMNLFAYQAPDGFYLISGDTLTGFGSAADYQAYCAATGQKEATITQVTHDVWKKAFTKPTFSIGGGSNTGFTGSIDLNPK